MDAICFENIITLKMWNINLKYGFNVLFLFFWVKRWYALF